VNYYQKFISRALDCTDSFSLQKDEFEAVVGFAKDMGIPTESPYAQILNIPPRLPPRLLSNSDLSDTTRNITQNTIHNTPQLQPQYTIQNTTMQLNTPQTQPAPQLYPLYPQCYTPVIYTNMPQYIPVSEPTNIYRRQQQFQRIQPYVPLTQTPVPRENPVRTTTRSATAKKKPAKSVKPYKYKDTPSQGLY
jgi:hypothetical protein